METYLQPARIGPTVIIRDFKAASTVDNRGGPPTPEDTSV